MKGTISAVPGYSGPPTPDMFSRTRIRSERLPLCLADQIGREGVKSCTVSTLVCGTDDCIKTVNVGFLKQSPHEIVRCPLDTETPVFVQE